MSADDKITLGVTVFAVLLTIFSIVGYILNICALYYSGLTPLEGKVILRIIGVFVFPLGAILGYL